MVKKKAGAEKNPPEEAIADAVETPAVIDGTQSPVPEGLPFELGKWQDFDQWRCRLCPYDTLEGEDAFWLHYAKKHAPVEESMTRTIQIYDRWGNPVS